MCIRDSFHLLPSAAIDFHELPYLVPSSSTDFHRLPPTSTPFIDFHRLLPTSVSFHIDYHMCPFTSTRFHRLFIASTQASIHFSCDFHEDPDRVRPTSAGFHFVSRLVRCVEVYGSSVLLPAGANSIVAGLLSNKLEADLTPWKLVEAFMEVAGSSWKPPWK